MLYYLLFIIVIISDAPPGFFNYLLTRVDESEQEIGQGDNDANYDANPAVSRKSSSLQALELENIYLTGSVLIGIDSDTTLAFDKHTICTICLFLDVVMLVY